MKLQFDLKEHKAQPDPYMCKVENGWAMYVTGVHGIEAYSCDSPFGVWKYRGIVCALEEHEEYWAPCMYIEDGWHYLYFSCREKGAPDAAEWMHVAKSKCPFGPFEDVRCLYDRFCIDPHVVRTNAGLFLLCAMDRTDCPRPGTRVYVDKLLDPVTAEGKPVEIVSPSFDQEIFMRDRFSPGEDWHTIEGPFWLQCGDWQYVMYSGACYQNETYHIGYASAKSNEQDLTKVAFEKHSDNGSFAPLMTKNGEEEGVGHHSVIEYDGVYYAVYHGRDLTDTDLPGDRRTARICRLRFSDGKITTQSL